MLVILGENKRYTFIVANVTLAIGALIYLCCRTTDLYFFNLFPDGRLPMWLVETREWIATEVNMPEWVRYSLPDGLWLFSYLLFIDLLWGNTMRKWKLLFLTALPVGILISEALQMLHVIPGTGDWMDILFYMLALFLFINIKYLQL